jgi:nucleoside-diphosphate-sugar epimerase
MRIFLAGATGIVGQRLIPLLVSAGHGVTGTARSEEKASAVQSLGAKPVIVDALDAASLESAVLAARPEVVIHQLTSLPDVRDADALPTEVLENNARIRIDGTRHLVRAALRAGARRLVAQSAAWLYAPGPLPHGEADPLDLEATGTRAISVRGVAELERLVSSSPPIEGVVLRFGYFYGPGSWYPEPIGDVRLHVEAAAIATALAATRGAAGAYNIVEAGGSATSAKARRELGWDPSERLGSRSP